MSNNHTIQSDTTCDQPWVKGTICDLCMTIDYPNLQKHRSSPVNNVGNNVFIFPKTPNSYPKQTLYDLWQVVYQTIQ